MLILSLSLLNLNIRKRNHVILRITFKFTFFTWINPNIWLYCDKKISFDFYFVAFCHDRWLLCDHRRLFCFGFDEKWQTYFFIDKNWRNSDNLHIFMQNISMTIKIFNRKKNLLLFYFASFNRITAWIG